MWSAEKAVAPHSSPLAWNIPRTKEPGGLQSMGSRRVGHDLSDFTFTSHFHALEKEMATHSSFLAWRIPGTAEPGGLPSMGSHRVGHDWSDLAAAAAVCAGQQSHTSVGPWGTAWHVQTHRSQHYSRRQRGRTSMSTNGRSEYMPTAECQGLH